MYNPLEKYKQENLKEKNCDKCIHKTDEGTCGFFLDELPSKKYYVCEAFEPRQIIINLK